MGLGTLIVPVFNIAVKLAASPSNILLAWNFNGQCRIILTNENSLILPYTRVV